MVMQLRKRDRSVSSQINDFGLTPKRHKVDRISQLPEPILHHIMSCLTTTQVWSVATTRSVSKTWNTAWNSYPVLEFDQRAFENFVNSSNKKNKVNRTSTKTKVDSFCNYVERSITRHNPDISLQKFRIVVDVYGKGRDAVPAKDIQRWLNYLKNKNVRSLSFRCLKNCVGEDWRYDLTDSLLCSKSSLEDLNLFGYKFLATSFGFSLRKLSLVHVLVDQISLQSFLSSCCNVEDVCIQHCHKFETLKLAVVKLKKVDFVLSRSKLQTIMIEAPSLQCIRCSGKWDNIKRSIMGSDCKNVKELVVCDSGTKSDISQILPLTFPSIEKVLLRTCGPKPQVTSEIITLPINKPRMLMPKKMKFDMMVEVYNDYGQSRVLDMFCGC